MRGLWVEDFDGSLDENVDIKNQLEKDLLTKLFGENYEKIKKTLTIKGDLVSSLEYIKQNYNKIDYVILDIDFPICYAFNKEINTIDKIVENYFEGYITKTYIENKLKQKTNSKDCQGIGVLVYRYLTEVIHYPKERIAFYSGKISNQTFSEDIVKILNYDKFNDIIEQLKKHILNEGLNIEIPTGCDDVDTLKNWIRENFSVNNQENQEKAGSTSFSIYTNAKKELANVGIEIGEKYEYDKGDKKSKIKTEFYDVINTDYIKFRYNVQELSRLILDKLKVDNSVLSLNVRNIGDRYKGLYNKVYYESLLNSIIDMPLNNSIYDGKYVNQVSSLIHSIEAFDFKDTNHVDFNEFKTLKFARNWHAHSILNDDTYDIKYLGFITVLSFGFFFDFDKFDELDKLGKLDELDDLDMELYQYYNAIKTIYYNAIGTINFTDFSNSFPELYNNYKSDFDNLILYLNDIDNINKEYTSVLLNFNNIFKNQKINPFSKKEVISKFFDNMGQIKSKPLNTNLSSQNVINFYHLLNYCDENKN